MGKVSEFPIPGGRPLGRGSVGWQMGTAAVTAPLSSSARRNAACALRRRDREANCLSCGPLHERPAYERHLMHGAALLEAEHLPFYAAQAAWALSAGKGMEDHRGRTRGGSSGPESSYGLL